MKAQTVLITGASMGIGAEFVRQLAPQVKNLILAARSKNRLENLAQELTSQHPVKVHVIALDLSKPESPRMLFDQIAALHLEVDLLINNAGFGRCGHFDRATAEEDQQMLMLNVNALTSLTHLFLPAMLRKRAGGIMNVASTAAYQPVAYLSVYGATKAYVLSLTEALWAEYRGSGVRFFCLCFPLQNHPLIS